MPCHREKPAPFALLAALRALALLTVLVVGCLAFALRSVALADEPPPAFRVIANPDNPAGSVSREFLERAFLKKASDWGDGTSIRPVDLRVDSGVRRAFSRTVLRRSTAAVRSYWQQQIFSGRGVPPPELDSDAAVVDYVLKHRGAVGYVAGSTDVKRAKSLAVN
jgi:hypothetical protein